MQQVVDAYKQATRRLILLDYDGTLVNIANTPDLAQPTSRVLTTLKRLASDANNEVVIISGRDQQILDNWFGKLDVALSAEHGFFTKRTGQAWRSSKLLDTSWRSTIKTIMQYAADALPGSFIEEKRSSLSWHYRLANEAKAERVMSQLLANVRDTTVSMGLRVLLGHKVVEIQPQGTNKGLVNRQWLQNGHFDFILVAGDDVTDEAMFNVMPKNAFSIKIGKPPTFANQSLPSPAELLKLLDTCTKA